MHLLALQRFARPLLKPISTAYRHLMAARTKRLLARTDCFRPPCPCVSVGNIAWGGTGKTPLIDWLLYWAEAKGLSSVVLTRGYRAKPPTLPMCVGPQSCAREVGDEPLMLQQAHPKSHIIVDPVRRRSGAFAAKKVQADLYMLDDGMQHLAVSRDLDLVLLRPDDILDQWDAVIPMGSWREGAHALTRAHAFLIKITPKDFAELTPQLIQRLQAFGRPVFSFWLEPEDFIKVGAYDAALPYPQKGQPYVLVSGVGEPAQVKATLCSYMGTAPVHHYTFTDHHTYTDFDVKAMHSKGLPVICTAKDAVKLAPLADAASRLWSVRTRLRFGPTLFSDQSFPCWWEKWWQTQQADCS